MSAEATVTIGLPVHDGAQSVLESVRSVFAQTYPLWHLLIVDDGSSDGTYDLLSQIDDPRVTLIRGTENRGLANRLNEIAERATTPLLARLDADDINHPRRLEMQLAYLDAHPQVDLVAADGISIDAHSRPKGYRTSIREATIDQHFTFGPYIHSVVTGRTEWFRKNAYDASLMRAEDQDLWIRTFFGRTLVVQQIPLLYVREAGYVSADKYARSIDVTKQIIRRHAPAHLSPMKTRKHLVLAEAKKVVYNAAARMGYGDRVIALRSRTLLDTECRHHEEILAQIQSTHIPGIDS